MGVWVAILILGAAAPAVSQAPEAAGRILDRIVAGEREFVARLAGLHPVLETYLQEVSDQDGPQADHYLLGRLDLSDGPSHVTYLASPAFQKRGQAGRKRASPLLTLSPDGFAQMVVPDADEFDRATYRFEYLRREFAGELRCLVFDVAPLDRKSAGKFVGRIWVEDQDYRIVRFNGTYTHSRPAAVFFHFDSWRVPSAAGWYAPAFIYIEESSPAVRDGRKLRLKGQTRLWGYAGPRSSRWEELTSVEVQPGAPVRDESAAPDLSPIESQRVWARQAEQNLLDRLERSGLLAPKGEVDRVLNTVVNNLLATNEVHFDVECRVLLTTPLETFSIGRTIAVSRGLLDVLPDEASLAAVLADELAHILLGHPTETMFAFGDRTIFPESETLERLRVKRTPEEVEAAGRRAVELLAKSPYQDQLGRAALFLKALAARAPRLPHLMEAALGNPLWSGGRLVRLAALMEQAPAVEERPDQIAALPLGSRIRLDPWTGEATLIKARPVPLLSPREKRPFEITPIVPHLTRSGPSAQAAKASSP